MSHYRRLFLYTGMTVLIILLTALISGCIPRADPEMCTPDAIDRPVPVSPYWDEITSTNPSLSWTYSDPDCPASSFEVIVGTNDVEVASHIGTVHSTTDTSLVWPDTLEVAKTYYWLVVPVVATTAGDVRGYGFDAVYPFNTGPGCVGNENPMAPVLIAPGDGFISTRLDGWGFYWDDPTTCIPKLYQVELSLTEDFLDPFTFTGERRTSLGIYSYEDFAFLDCTKYYWRVRGLMEGISYGPYSDIWNFSTNAGTIICPTDLGFVTPPAPIIHPPIASAKVDANCRSGPTMDYPVRRVLLQGEQYPVVGRSQDGLTWVIGLVAIDDEITWTPEEIRENGCWVHGDLVEVLGDTSLVMIANPDPPPLVLPTDTPVVNCSQYTNPSSCTNNQACWWDPNDPPQSNGSCKNK